MSNFYTDFLQKNVRYRSLALVNSLDFLEPVTRTKVQQLLAMSPVKLFVFETYRSAERQQLLYARGATQLQTVGVHHYGLACDIVRNVGGDPSWKGDFEFLGELAKKVGLIWGGDWGHPEQSHTFRDMDHVQRIAVADQERLFSEEWYPDDEYTPATDAFPDRRVA